MSKNLLLPPFVILDQSILFMDTGYRVGYFFYFISKETFKGPQIKGDAVMVLKFILNEFAKDYKIKKGKNSQYIHGNFYGWKCYVDSESRTISILFKLNSQRDAKFFNYFLELDHCH